MKYPTFKAILAAVAMLCADELPAAVVQYNVKWSGAPNGNSATATAVISIDTALVSNPGFNVSSISVPLWLIDFQVTIQGATSGNGTFQRSDFNLIFWNTSTEALDLGQELVGQTTSGQPWGLNPGSSSFGDFNFFSSGENPNAPTGTATFQLTPSGSSDTMNLTSFAPVPEPTSTMLVAFASLTLAIRRRRWIKTPKTAHPREGNVLL